MRIRVVPRGARVVSFGDASPAVYDTNTGQTTSSVSLSPDMSTLEVFVLAGIATHIAVRLIDKIWR